MSVIIKGDTINDRIAEVTTRTLIDMIVEDVIDHVDRLKDASTEESPDSEKVEYHHARIMLRIGQLKGVVIHNGI